MALNSFDRNYGASLNSREFFFGNNGWLTLSINMPGTAELGETTSSANVDSDEYATAKSAAEYNQFKLAELIGQRCVITATSDIRETSSVPTFTVGGNVLATVSNGTPAIGADAVSFLIERADVFTTQDAKPGAVNPSAYAVNPLAELVTAISTLGFFRDATGVDVEAANIQIAVLAAFPPILEA